MRSTAVSVTILVVLALSIPALGSNDAPTWARQSPVPTAYELWAADMVSASEGWAVGNAGVVLHTTDGGVTWEHQSIGSNSQLLDVEFKDPLHGWVAGATVWHTTDGGTTWHAGNGLPYSLAGIGFRDLQTGFATTSGGSGGGMYRTKDGGKTWKFVQTKLPITDVQFFDAQHGVASGPEGVMHTSDGGSRWSAVPGDHGGFFVDPKHGWYAFENTAAKTTDGGRTWTTQFLPSEAWVYSGAVFVDDSNGWAVGYGLSIVHTSNGGKTWKSQFGGGERGYYDRYSLNGVDFADASHGVAIGENGALFTTSNGGADWVNRQSGSGNSVLGMSAVDRDHAWASMEFGEVLSTADGGRTWVRSNPYHQYSLLNDISFADTTDGWVVGEDYNDDYNGIIFHSGDGGKTWLQQWRGGGLSQQFSVEALDAQTVVAGGAHGVMRTIDGGQSWASVGTFRGAVFDVDFVGNVGWATGGNNLVMKSTNRGKTWSPGVQMPMYIVTSISFAPNQKTGWAVGFYGEVMSTTDGGAHWFAQHPGVEQTTISSVSAISAKEAWITGGSGPFGGDAFVRHTTDGGSTWVDMTPPMDPLNAIIASAFISDSYGWVGGTAYEPGGGIWRRAAA
jgi:photosystem II stability/assembly factor-like uncharacterized protein